MIDKVYSTGGFARIVILGIFVFVLLFGFYAKPQMNVRSIPARLFLDSLGINVHLEYTDGKYANVAQVLDDLNYLGITHVRDGVPLPGIWMPPGKGLAAINTLAAAGVRFDVVMTAPDLKADLSQVLNLETTHSGMINAIEGPNEINNWPVTYTGSTGGSATGNSAAIEFQHDLYEAVHSNELLNKLPVFYLTGGPPTKLEFDNKLADALNDHPYPQKGEQPGDLFEKAFINDYAGSTIAKVITETGYRTQPESQDGGGVDGITQAKGILAVYFEAKRQGIAATYLYQLLDAYVDSGGGKNDYHYGVFEYDNVPKPAAVAIHNLTQFLADGQSSARTLSYRLEGKSSTVRSLLLSKSDGSFVMALWNATPFWNESKKQSIDSNPVPLRLVLSQKANVEWFDPLTNAAKIFAANARFDVDVPDHPVLLKIKSKN